MEDTKGTNYQRSKATAGGASSIRRKFENMAKDEEDAEKRRREQQDQRQREIAEQRARAEAQRAEEAQREAEEVSTTVCIYKKKKRTKELQVTLFNVH